MIKRLASILPGVALAALLSTQSGCAARVSYSASAAPASLVAVGPGVWTVYDYHQPVFYSNGFYWLWSGGMWYQSRYVDYGFSRVHVSHVPTAVVRIDRPSRYVRYRGTGAVRSVPPGHVRRSYATPNRGRDTRAAPPPGRGTRAAPPPGRGTRAAPPPSRGRGTSASPPPGRGHRAAPPSRGRGTSAAPPPGRSYRSSTPSRGRGTSSAPPPSRSRAASPSRGGGGGGSRGRR